MDGFRAVATVDAHPALKASSPQAPRPTPGSVMTSFTTAPFGKATAMST